MASAFFPEKMGYFEFICPLESSYKVIKHIARQGCAQLVNLNHQTFGSPKRHADMFMACESAERCLRFIETYVKAAVDDTGNQLLKESPSYESYISCEMNFRFSEIVDQIKEADSELRDKVGIFQSLQKQIAERKTAIDALDFYLPIVERRKAYDNDRFTLTLFTAEPTVNSIVGFVPSNLVNRITKTVFRVSRRNAFCHIGKSTNGLTPCAIFTSSPAIRMKVKTVCESFCSDVFEFPSDVDSLDGMRLTLQAELDEMSAIEATTRQKNQEYLKYLADNYWFWRFFISQEKQIWESIDFGDFTRAAGSVVYNMWCPERYKARLIDAIEAANHESGGVEIYIMETADHDNAPTFIEKNDFNTGFQMLNDAYGVPNYDELNAGAFYCIYPFLFGIMFGDIGHSIFYIIAAIALLVIDPIAKRQRWKLSDITSACFKFKWILFFAAVCSLYCGFMYNETFGLPIYMAKSHWKKEEIGGVERWTKADNEVYPFGIDPEWIFKDNELIFLNSYKMKLSVVIGMTQMIFGMFLQFINHCYRKDISSIFLKWLPEMLYLVPFFGYMVVIIIKKWLTNFAGNEFYTEEQQENGVNLIQMMIGMILSFGTKDKEFELYNGQWTIQQVITIIFFCSVPYLLFAKPIYDCITKKDGSSILEIFVMNLISVIEFCLGALSHTASYLRLWALSLAHSQLSHVIYDELFVMELKLGNVVLMFVAFAAFCVLTAAILLGMEGFSAMLHAIRLMWVEFSSKFYEGMGTPFKPLSLKKQLKSVIA